MIFDIGAHHGKWTLANYNVSDTFVVVEASPNTFIYTKSAICRYSNCILLNTAVGEQSGTISFYEAAASTVSTTNLDWLTKDSYRFKGMKYKETSVPCVTLDSLIQTYGKPSLIKVDVEGAEYRVIKGLSQKVDMLCFEWAIEMKTDIIDTLQYLTSIGFTSFYIQHEDAYTFRPKREKMYNINTCIDMLHTYNKKEWGMIWCV